MRDLTTTVTAAPLLPANRQSVGTATGSALDTAGFDELTVILDSGDFAADATLDVKIQGSADGSTGWADIASAVFPTVVAAVADEAVVCGRITLGKHQRYVRAIGVVAVGSNATYSLVAVLSGTGVLPVAEQQQKTL